MAIDAVLVRGSGPSPPARGWTLIELLLVLAIIGTLATLAIPALERTINLARIARAIGDIEALQIDIATFRSGADTLPTSLATIGRGTMLDPWGQPYRYLRIAVPGAKGPGPIGQARKDRFLVPLNSDFDLYSSGKDQSSKPPLNAAASRDDVIRANDGGFIGLAAKY